MLLFEVSNLVFSSKIISSNFLSLTEPWAEPWGEDLSRLARKNSYWMVTKSHEKFATSSLTLLQSNFKRGYFKFHLCTSKIYPPCSLEEWEEMGEGKTPYTFSVSVNAFSVEFPLACYQQAGRVWYVSGALRRTYMLFYPAPEEIASNG
jgi:hypothetical protein